MRARSCAENKQKMANRLEIERLCALLVDQAVLAQRNYVFVADESDGVVVRRGPHVRGLWRCFGGEFGWIPAGYAEPTHYVRDAEAAMRYTLVVLATAP